MRRPPHRLLRPLVASLVLPVAAVSVLARQLPPPPPPPPPPVIASPTSEMRKGAGFVLGRVLDAGTNQPVAGAIVTITGFGALPGGVPGGAAAAAPVTSEALTPSAPRRVVTDRDGYFFFVRSRAVGSRSPHMPPDISLAATCRRSLAAHRISWIWPKTRNAGTFRFTCGSSRRSSARSSMKPASRLWVRPSARCAGRGPAADCASRSAGRRRPTTVACTV